MEVRVRLAWFVLSLAMIFAPARAQDYPSRPIRILIPAAPGGTTDLLARLFAAKLQDSLKTPVLAENKASASGVIAGEQTAQAAPDGYTLMLAYHQHTINGAMTKLPYHPVNDFTPITQLTRAGLLLVVNPASPPKALQEFVAWTKQKSGSLNYGSAGLGSGGHLAGELYKQMAGVKAEHIPYKGSGPSIVDLLAGRYDYSFAGVQAAAPHVRSGKLRALAITTPQRVGAMPDVPAVAEALPGYEFVGWYGVLGPANLPAPIVARLHDELVKILGQPEVKERILADGSEPVSNSPAEFRDFMNRDLAKWTRLVKESGAKFE
jgi:tripartite-type tricarboxylate transporter receptor subunit TctC